MKKPNKKKETAAIEELVWWLNRPRLVETHIKGYVASRMNGRSEEAKKRSEEIRKAWELVCNYINIFIPGFPRLVARLFSLWPPEVGWITSQPLDLSPSEEGKLTDEEWIKRRSIPPGQITRLELKGLPVLSLLNAAPYLRPGIIRRCNRTGCTMFLTGWDRKDYCSKKCHPKREYDPSRNPYQKVLMTAKRLAKIKPSTPEIDTTPAIRGALVTLYGEDTVKKCFNPGWSFLKMREPKK